MNDWTPKSTKRKILEWSGYWIFVLSIAVYNQSGWMLFVGFVLCPILLKETPPTRDMQLQKIQTEIESTNNLLRSIYRSWLEGGSKDTKELDSKNSKT